MPKFKLSHIIKTLLVVSHDVRAVFYGTMTHAHFFYPLPSPSLFDISNQATLSESLRLTSPVTDLDVSFHPGITHSNKHVNLLLHHSKMC